MSAWIVDRRHIDVLVTALEPSSQDVGDYIGRLLWRENVTSVAYRYPDDGPRDRPGPAGFHDSKVAAYTWIPAHVPPHWVNAAARCLDYQSCEHPEWETSVAKMITDRLEEANPATDSEFDKAPWGIDDSVLVRLTVKLAEA